MNDISRRVTILIPESDIETLRTSMPRHSISEIIRAIIAAFIRDKLNPETKEAANDPN